MLYKSSPQNVQAREPAVALYDPAAHAEHALPSAPVNPALHWHCVERLLPTGDWELDGHSSQLEGVVAPATVEYVPAPQSVHVLATEAPEVVEYFPAPQLMHVLAADARSAVEYCPALQFWQTEAEGREYVPALQCGHEKAAPVENVPAAHAEQFDAADAQCAPAGQKQPTAPAGKTGLNPKPGPTSQALHAEAPATSEYVPTSQKRHDVIGISRHARDPTTFLYLPAAHALHGPPSGPVNAALHWQLLRLVLSRSDVEFPGQLEQAAEPTLAL